MRIDPERTYLFQDAIRCAAAQFGVEQTIQSLSAWETKVDFDAAGCGWMRANHPHTFGGALNRATKWV